VSTSTQSLRAALAERAPGAVAEAAESDAVAGVRPRVVVTPGSAEEVAAVLAFADREGLKVLPRGGGTQLGLGFPPTGGDILLSTTRLSAIVEHAPHDQTVSVLPGLPLADLQASLAHTRQWLALDPPSGPAATLGGLIAANPSGPRRLRYGGVRDQIIGVRVALADGTIAKGGGKVVKNVAGYDLPKLFTGSLGTLGVIVGATFRLYPLAAASRTLMLRAPDLAALGDLALRVTASQLVPAAIDIAGASDEDAATFAVSFETGGDAAAEEQASEARALAGSLGAAAETLSGAAEDALWERLDAGLTSPPTAAAGTAGTSLMLKASVVPTGVARWLARLGTAAREGGVRARWRAHAGHGLIYARFEGTAEALIALVEPLRAAAQVEQGSLVVADAPPAIASEVDVWGPSAALDVMRGLKARFDPHGTLNPGRFVGGI
jgi:glycolate dehydrogenase FAD-binding subunit